MTFTTPPILVMLGFAFLMVVGAIVGWFLWALLCLLTFDKADWPQNYLLAALFIVAGAYAGYWSGALLL